MIDISFSAEFLGALKKLPASLQEETLQKVEEFKDRANHRRLRVHKLHGPYADCWSFSVNYRFRVIFIYLGKHKSAVGLVTIGDHSVYG